MSTKRLISLDSVTSAVSKWWLARRLKKAEKRWKVQWTDGFLWMPTECEGVDLETAIKFLVFHRSLLRETRPLLGRGFYVTSEPMFEEMRIINSITKEVIPGEAICE